jgi:hypothetical protein
MAHEDRPANELKDKRFPQVTIPEFITIQSSPTVWRNLAHRHCDADETGSDAQDHDAINADAA